MTVKDDKLTVQEEKDFWEYKEEQIANRNKFSFPAQLQYCHDNYDGKQPSSSQSSRVWLKREEWKKVKPGRGYRPIVVSPMTGRTIGMVLDVSWGQAQPYGMLPD
jgi:hypothetical protein